jgi:hypothetical protein
MFQNSYNIFNFIFKFTHLLIHVNEFDMLDISTNQKIVFFFCWDIDIDIDIEVNHDKNVFVFFNWKFHPILKTLWTYDTFH